MTPQRELELIEAELDGLRFAGLDQNPKGMRDRLSYVVAQLNKQERTMYIIRILNRDLLALAVACGDKGLMIERATAEHTYIRAWDEIITIAHVHGINWVSEQRNVPTR